MKSIRILFILGILIFIPITTSVNSVPFFISEEEEQLFSNPVVLVTGFEPFGQYEVNPAQLIAETLDGQDINGATVVGVIVPVDFDDSVAVVRQAIEDFEPDILISIGLSPYSRLISVEKIGINFKRDPDGENFRERFGRLETDGPFLRFSTLPTFFISREIRRSGIPCKQSCFAGTYICNALFYGILGYISENDLSITAGFLHVPPLSSQDLKGLDLDVMVNATNIAIEVTLQEI